MLGFKESKAGRVAYTERSKRAYSAFTMIAEVDILRDAPLSLYKGFHLAAERVFSFLRTVVSGDHYLQDLLSEIAFTKKH